MLRGRWQRLVGVLSSAGLWLGGVCLIAALIVIVLQIGGRFFNYHIPSSNVIAGYLVGDGVFLGLAGTFNAGKHIRVTLLLDRQIGKIREVLEILCLICALLVVTLMAYWLGRLALYSYVMGSKATGLVAIPLYIPQAIMVLGCFLWTLQILQVFINYCCASSIFHKFAVRNHGEPNDGA